MSQALADLESGLKVSLINRSSRSFALTQTGARVYEEAMQMMLAANAALDCIEPYGGQLQGRLSITLPIELAMSWLPQQLLAFYKQYPQLDIHIHAVDDEVDLPQSDIELAIRCRYQSPGHAISNPSRVIPVRLVAHPEQIEAYEQLIATEQPLPFIGFLPRQENHRLEVRKPGQTAITTIETMPLISVNNALLAHQLCRSAVGAALMLEPSLSLPDQKQPLAPLLQGCDFGHVQLLPIYRDAIPRRAAQLLVDHLLGTDYNKS